MNFFTAEAFAQVERLEKTGLPREQAVAIVQSQHEVLEHAATNVLATKSDLSECVAKLQADIGLSHSELKADMGSLRSELQTDMASLRTELQAEMGSLRSELHADMASLRSDLKVDMTSMRAELRHEMIDIKSDIIKWVAGMLVAQAAVVSTLVKLL